jgi:hypothetical protein
VVGCGGVGWGFKGVSSVAAMFNALRGWVGLGFVLRSHG